MPWSRTGGYTGIKVDPNKPKPVPPKTTGSLSPKKIKEVSILLIPTSR